MSKILVVSGHPDLDNSTANKTIIENLENLLPNVYVHRLDKAISNGNFDIKKEQELIEKYDTLVFVSPFYWYSWSSLMKKWVDEVFVFGFAHGLGGDKVKNKKIMLSFTTGAPIEEYTHEGAMKHSVEEFLYPVEGLANLCQMIQLPHVYSNGMSFIPQVHGEERLKEVQNKAKEQAKKIAKIIRET